MFVLLLSEYWKQNRFHLQTPKGGRYLFSGIHSKFYAKKLNLQSLNRQNREIIELSKFFEMMTAHRTSTDIPDDPIGAYARQSPPVFSQIHVPEISKINTGYLKSLPGILKLTTIVSCYCFSSLT